MRILFIHGGGDDAYAFDRDVVSRLSNALGNSASIDYPRIEGLEQLDWNTTQPQLTELLRSAAEGTVLVAHSIGASAALKLLTNGTSTKITHVVLLAPPYKAADSHWGTDDFTFPNDFGANLPGDIDLGIYHCEDDDIIPIEDAHEYRRKLPKATVSLLQSGGHQFAGSIDSVARAVSSRVSRR